MSALQTRRDTLRLAMLFGVAAAVPIAIASPTIPAAGTWESLIWQVGNWGGPGLQLALRHARAAGMKVDEVASLNFPQRDGGWVTFYLEDKDELRSFDMDGERPWHS